MADWFADGRIVDLIMGLVAIEALGLFALRRWAGIGPGLVPVAATLAAGACILMALRGALAGAPWTWSATWLLGALVAHLADLARRWRAAD